MTPKLLVYGKLAIGLFEVLSQIGEKKHNTAVQLNTNIQERYATDTAFDMSR